MAGVPRRQAVSSIREAGTAGSGYGETRRRRFAAIPADARKLTALSHAHRRLLLEAFLVVAGIRIFLLFTSLTALHSRLTARPPGSSGVTFEKAGRLAWAVETAARRVPGATCLPQALALQLLLRHRGAPSCVRVGFLADEEGAVRGHAWLEWSERVLIGGSDLSKFTCMVTLDG